ncbi:DUF2345 domain-containing protein, partial [Jeongeupia chitinilytica]|uniref:DUF2345 domain-containing protein n=1 Tax=Jeongeupia chitinilytica TaxID=1041641 RepID=UPI00167430C0
GEHISLFVAGVKDQIALKLIAAKGKVQVQAQSDNVEINAAKDITETANQKVFCAAKEEILLTAGGAYIRIKGGNIEIHAPGKIDVKGASHSLDGPASMNAAHPDYPKSAYKQPINLSLGQSPISGGTHWAGMPFTLLADGAEVQKGVMDESAALSVMHEVITQKYTLELANGVKFDIPVVSSLSDPEKGDQANRGFHKFEGGSAPEEGRVEPDDHARLRYAKLFNAAGGEAEGQG